MRCLPLENTLYCPHSMGSRSPNCSTQKLWLGGCLTDCSVTGLFGIWSFQGSPTIIISNWKSCNWGTLLELKCPQQEPHSLCDNFLCCTHESACFSECALFKKLKTTLGWVNILMQLIPDCQLQQNKGKEEQSPQGLWGRGGGEGKMQDPANKRQYQGNTKSASCAVSSPGFVFVGLWAES